MANVYRKADPEKQFYSIDNDGGSLWKFEYISSAELFNDLITINLNKFGLWQLNEPRRFKGFTSYNAVNINFCLGFEDLEYYTNKCKVIQTN